MTPYLHALATRPVLALVAFAIGAIGLLYCLWRLARDPYRREP